ncbi:putative membrane protein [Leptospira interrogans serovar Canicola]|nr:putative membrane protein [Leptospira interrogans serovar Canicola]
MYRKNIKNLIKGINPLGILLGILPIILFFLWNLWDYGHILGVRFIFNYGIEHASILDRIHRFFSIIFVNYVNGAPKFGLFFCSSFLLLPVLYYVFF